MEVKITKRTSIREQINDMCANRWWLINGKIYDGTSDEYKYERKFRLVVWIDLTDLWEKADCDGECGSCPYRKKCDDGYIPKTEREYLDEIIDSYLELLPWSADLDFTQGKYFKPFYDACRDSIEDYNSRLPKYAW